MRRQALLTGLLVLFPYCSSPQITGGVAGKNYFEPGFRCERGFLKKETDPVYLKIRADYRNAFSPVNERPFIVFAGESTIALFRKEIYEKYFSGYTAVNRAIGGETTVLFLTSMEEDILSLKPDVIVLSLGGNDLLGGRCLNTILNNLNLIFFKIKERLPETRIVFVSIPPVLSWKVNTITPYFNQKVQKLLRQYPGTYYLDLWEILSDEEVPRLREEFYREMEGILQGYDELHFNNKGYEEIAKHLKPILDSIYTEKYSKK